MTSPKRPDDADRQRSDRLEVAAAAAAVEHDRFSELVTIVNAEGVVTTARQADLLAAQQQAKRRWAAAKGVLTKAQKDGSATKIVAARKRCDDAYTEFTRISDAAIAEMQQITGARLDGLGNLLDQMRRSWTAGDAAIDVARHEQKDTTDE